MSLLTLSAIGAFACAAYYAYAARKPDDGFRRFALAGAVLMTPLAVFLAYFAWREHRALDEIASVITPIPQVTDVMRVPSPAEIQALAEVMAAVPGDTKLGTTQEERRALAEDVRDLDGRYWQLHTALSPDEALAFYRERAPAEGWTITTDAPPYLMLERTAERLALFIQTDWKRGDTEVWYQYRATRSGSPAP